MKWIPIDTPPQIKRHRPAPDVLLYFPTLSAERPEYVLREMMKVGRWNCWGTRQPTHWMPLPEPPESES